MDGIFLTANAMSAGLATFQERDPISGRFDKARFNQGLVLFVTKGVREKEEPLDK